ncbi:MAG: fumarate hydratase C-terminal domain-containing protein [Planctomycetes bacterium]|nr:fumarate hydratase C-terminal domain-containing protein [Planctomycetota bacterium]
MATKLTTPISEEQIRALRVGDQVLLNGVIFTGRDAAHKYMIENFIRGECPESEKETYEVLKKGLADSVIYHCGPVVRKGDDGKYEFIAAGPTTSMREESYQAEVIEHFGVRAVIGKGGMGDKTLSACKEHGAVYLHAIGGAAVVAAQRVTEVLNVYKLDLGLSEAFWEIRVEDFPSVVTMDSHGQSLHDKVRAESEKKFRELMGSS